MNTLIINEDDVLGVSEDCVGCGDDLKGRRIDGDCECGELVRVSLGVPEFVFSDQRWRKMLRRSLILIFLIPLVYMAMLIPVFLFSGGQGADLLVGEVIMFIFTAYLGYICYTGTRREKINCIRYRKKNGSLRIMTWVCGGVFCGYILHFYNRSATT